MTDGLTTTPPLDPAVRRDRCRGVMLGLAVGNLLGLHIEGWSREEIYARFPNGVADIDPAERRRRMDDDLAQAVELAGAILNRGNFVGNFADRLVTWRRENGRGIGSTTSAVIGLLEQGVSVPDAAREIFRQRDFIAPNGGLMRCAPVALARRTNPDRLVADTAATCAVTHYAPACQWSCIMVNVAIGGVLAGAELSPEALATAAAADGAPGQIQSWLANLDEAPNDLAFDQGHIGHTLLCLRAAMWALATPNGLEPALRAVVNAGGDTDTNGAVAGAILGARFGASAIPRRWLDNIPQRVRIQRLADDLCALAD